MHTLVSCPSCLRHARVVDAACPFCGAPLAATAPPALPALTRRDIVRGAVYALGVGVALAACGGSQEASDDGTGGGEDTREAVFSSDEADFSSDEDRGAGRDTRVAAGGADAGVDAGPPDVEVETVEHPYDNRRHRVLPPCVHEGTCPAPPYGAPPSRELFV